jgi:molecular chaperone GrpE (heat shock protein)
VLLAAAWFFIQRSPHPISQTLIIVASSCAALGAILGCLPFILDYRTSAKTIDASALGSISEKIQNLEKLAAQISAATKEWTNVQTQAEKISNGASDIAARMAEEVRQFSDFMQKMNDSEKAALRLEVEKLRRAEGDWLQVLVRILDHVFALHAAAERSGQPKLTDQISSFQGACLDVARRIGLLPFAPAPDEPFDSAQHQTVDGVKAGDGAVVSETVAAGYTFQGKLLRRALVQLRGNISTKESELPRSPEKESAEQQLQLGSAG